MHCRLHTASQHCFQQEEVEHVELGPVLWSQIQTNTKAPLIQARVKVSPKPMILKICQYIWTRAAAGLEQNREHLLASPREIRSSSLASNFPDRLFELGSREVCACPLCRIKLRSVLTALWNICLRNQCAVPAEMFTVDPSEILGSIQCVFMAYILFILTWSL